MRIANEYRRGLTLVEMLVIVAALAVMIGILLPAMDAAKYRANMNECQGNLRTIGMALSDYSQANEGLLLKARFLAPPIIQIGKAPSLTVALVGYIKAATDVFHCPGDEMYLYQSCGMSYFYHFTLGGKTIDQATTDPRWSSADRLPLLWDAHDTVFPTTTGHVDVPPFHDVRMSLFADWHVGTLDQDKTPFF